MTLAARLYRVVSKNRLIHRTNTEGNDFAYDANGNMTKDLDRGISNIRYNLLNLPVEISFDNGHWIRNLYAADGRKLRSSYSTALSLLQPLDNTTTGVPFSSNSFDRTIQYAGNIEYKTKIAYEESKISISGVHQIVKVSKNELERVHNSEGYVDDSGNYNYYRRDHLGNNREVWQISPEGQKTTIQYTQYYPSGLPWAYNEEDNPDLQPYKYNGKEFIEMHGLDEYYSVFRNYYPAIMRTTTIDPHAENYYDTSPYAWAGNNPILNIDPNGMDVYRYDDKTGEFILRQETEDNFDQVGKFKYDKKTGEYTLKTNKKGEAKTRIDNVEKGILSDGINFKENNNIIAVGGEGQASVGGVEAFAVNLSDMVSKEIGGAYFSKDGSSETTHVSIGRYVNNKFDETRGHGQNFGSYPHLRGDYNKFSLTGFFHTHPSRGNISVSDRTRPSGKDLESRNKDLKLNPSMQFYILTHPVSYGGTFPYKINYTNW